MERTNHLWGRPDSVGTLTPLRHVHTLVYAEWCPPPFRLTVSFPLCGTGIDENFFSTNGTLHPMCVSLLHGLRHVRYNVLLKVPSSLAEHISI